MTKGEALILAADLVREGWNAASIMRRTGLTETEVAEVLRRMGRGKRR